MEEPDAVRRLERMREHALAGKKTTPTRNLWFLTDKGCNWLEAQAPRRRVAPQPQRDVIRRPHLHERQVKQPWHVVGQFDVVAASLPRQVAA